MVPHIMTHRDILDEVFSHLVPRRLDTDEPYWIPSDRKLLRSTLAASALVCHAFSDKALDCLWRVLDSVVPLLRILPSTGSRECIHIDEDISDAAWSRFQEYARRVRELKSVETHVHFHPSSWPIVMNRLGGAPLLPLLRHLEAVIMLPDPSPGIILLSPTLRSLRLSFPQFMAMPEPLSFYETSEYHLESNDLVEDLVRFISLPSIPDDIRRRLHAAVPERSNHLQALGRFTSLQEVDLLARFPGIRVGHTVLRALSSLDSLRALRVDLAAGAIPHSTSYRDGFPALDALSLRSNDEECLRLLRALPLNKLAKLELITETGIIAEDYKHLLASIRALVPSNLKHLTLVPEKFPLAPTVLSLSDMLQPMLSLRELRELVSECKTYPRDVSDDDLHAFGTAWPKLTSFSATYTYGGDSARDGVQPITVAGLIDLLQRCPHLESVCLPTLDVAHLPSPDSVPRLDNRVWELEVDRFVGEAEADLHAFARIVDRLVPCLEIPQSMAVDYLNLWDKVRLLVVPVRAARHVAA